MGYEEEEELISTPVLQLFSNTNTHNALMQSPARSGTLTPPLYSTSAAVPFRWEEEPGKPRGCSSFNAVSIPKCLELPPRLLDPNYVTKLNSPTTVLEGPYKSRFQSSSFRIEGRERECYGSFRRSWSPERRDLVVSRGSKDRSFLGSWRWGRKGKREVVGPCYVFPNSSIDKHVEEKEDDNVKITIVPQSGSFSRSPFWAAVYGSLKQVVPWRGRKQKKGGSAI